MTDLTIGTGARAMRALVFDAPESLGEHVAQRIRVGILAARSAGRRYLLGCPGGRSAQSTYEALARQTSLAQDDLSHVVIVMMDDYVVAGPAGFAPCPADAHYSCRRFARDAIAGLLNRGRPAAQRIPADQVWFPDPAAPGAYEERLEEAGGIDLFITASGASDGHVAFNPPGSALDSRTRVVPLAESTRRDNLQTFPVFRDLSEVPQHGVTVGLGTIRTRSREVVLIIHGAGKRQAVSRLAACADFDPRWPASFILRCTGAAICLDRESVVDIAETGDQP